MGTLTINNLSCTTYFPNYGLLYNYYAVDDSRKISSSDDWVVDSVINVASLLTELGGGSIAGGKLKETGLTHWDSPNSGATNETFFNARGNGVRNNSDGTFSGLNLQSNVWLSRLGNEGADESRAWVVAQSISTISLTGISGKKNGYNVRLRYIGAGTPDYYTGNNGKKYRVVTVGGQIWMADSLAETKFRNGDTIPYHGLNNVNNFTNSEWAALTTAGCCAYNNDTENVAIGFTFPS